MQRERAKANLEVASTTKERNYAEDYYEQGSQEAVLQAGPQAFDRGKLSKSMWDGFRLETIKHSCPDHLTLLREKRNTLGVLLLLITQRTQAALMIPSCPAQKSVTPLVKPESSQEQATRKPFPNKLAPHRSVYIFHCAIPLRHLPPSSLCQSKALPGGDAHILLALTSPLRCFFSLEGV